MKVLERTLEVDSTLEGERVGMTIDDSALAHIMSVLTDLYSDPELAVIREYSTNALDAHIAAGVTRPIEVTLPTPLSPFLRIRDFGAGLDAEDIRAIYSRYGTSTKRDSNDVVGMLGLGCKSALTYSDQFTLTGIKQGVMTQVSVSRDEDGAGSMTIVAQHDTTDESGVEVTIPVKRHNSLDSKAAEFFSVWAEGTVLVNGEQPTRVTGTWVTPTICLQHTGGYKPEHKIVMGNVPYPLDASDARELGWKWPYGYSLIAFVPIGAVQFTPSRESLQMTKHTKEALTRINQDAQTALAASLQAQVAQAATPFEAVKLARQARSLGVSGLVYRGYEVPDALTRGSFSGTPYLQAPMTTGYRLKKAGHQKSTCPLDDEVLYFDGFDGAELTPTKRAKMELWLQENRPALTAKARIVFTQGFTPAERFWIPKDAILDWSPVNAVKLPKKVNPDGTTSRPKGSYRAKTPAGSWYGRVEADKIDTTIPLVYIDGNHYEGMHHPAFRDHGPLAAWEDKITVVCLERNRTEKFKRDFPEAKHINDFAREKAREWYSQLDAETLTVAAYQRGGVEYTRARVLDPEQVLDPNVKEAIKLAKKQLPLGTLERLLSWKYWIDAPELSIPDNPLDKYPLLSFNDLGGAKMEHVYLYMNAVYQAAGEGGDTTDPYES